MGKETILDIALFVMFIAFNFYIIKSIKKIDVFYKIDGFYFEDKKSAKKYWENQVLRKRNDLFIYTYDFNSKTRVDKSRCDNFFKK